MPDQAAPPSPADARREAIMRAAFDVFVEKGFEAATTAEIVRRAKTSKRALYELFGNKQEILTALVRYGSQQMQAPPDLPPPANREQFIATLEAFGGVFLQVFLHPERTAMYRLAIEGGHGGAVARELEAGGRLPVQQSITRYFDQAAQRGLIAAEDVPLLVHTLFSVLIGLAPLQQLLGTQPPMPPEAIRARAAMAASVIRRLINSP
jgi:AcrR family transcriptional regulator